MHAHNQNATTHTQETSILQLSSIYSPLTQFNSLPIQKRRPNMASLLFPPFFLVIFFPLSLLPNTLSQIPTISQCGPRLLPLAACAPFVQGTARSPGQPCCDSILQLYNQQPSCLCLLLNGTTALTSFPINATLALQLPSLCNLRVDASNCSGGPVSPTRPKTQASPVTKPNLTAPATPAITPRTSSIGIGLGRSSAMELNSNADVAAVVATMAFLLTKLFC